MPEPKTTILVVDDEEHVRTLLKRILEGAVMRWSQQLMDARPWISYRC